MADEGSFEAVRGAPRVLAARMRSETTSSRLLDPWDGSLKALDLDDDSDRDRPCDDMMCLVAEEDLRPDQRLNDADDETPLTMDWEEARARGLSAYDHRHGTDRHPQAEGQRAGPRLGKCACCSEANLGLDAETETERRRRRRQAKAPSPPPPPPPRSRRFLAHRAAPKSRAEARATTPEKEAVDNDGKEGRLRGGEAVATLGGPDALLRRAVDASRPPSPAVPAQDGGDHDPRRPTQELSSMLTCCTNKTCLERMGMRALDFTTRWRLAAA